MKITELYIYPIKSLRPCSVPRMRLEHEGPEHDRRFMLLRVDDAGAGRHTNVQVYSFPECALFDQEIDGDDVVVTYRTPKGQEEGGEIEEAEAEAEEVKKKKTKQQLHRIVLSAEEQRRPALRVPLKPSTRDRETVEVKLFGTTAIAYRMGEEPYDSWFSARLGYRVMLVYIGDSRRTVLAHSPNNPSRESNHSDVTTTKQGWLSSLASYVTSSISAVKPPSPERRDRDFLTFNEAAPFLVTSRASLRDVSSRLPQGEEMDMIAFRPNIVVDDDHEHEHDGYDGSTDDDHDSGYDGSSDDGPGHGRSSSSSSTSLKPYEEDYWAELLVGGSGSGRSDDGPRLALTANCARCVSINIDYETGRPAEGERGSVLKKLMKDRRVDTGNKWSPIFGRYAFLLPTASAARQQPQQQDDEGEEGGDEDVVAGAEADATAAADIAVGDEVRVTRRSSDRDVWSWPKTS